MRREHQRYFWKKLCECFLYKGLWMLKTYPDDS